MTQIVVPEILSEHWRFLLLSWVGFNIVSTMPSPKQTGFTSTWCYLWAFGIAQAFKGSIPRIIATMFPSLVKSVPFMGTEQQKVTAQEIERR
jgi:hypothetical protein